MLFRSATMTEGPQLFRYLNFMLAFAQPQDSEKDLLARFAKIGIAPGAPFKAHQLTAEQRKALEDGIADGRAEFAAFKKDKIDTHQVSSGDLFGSRDRLKNNCLYRYAGADLGIFGNSTDEAIYLSYFVDSEGKPANGAPPWYLRQVTWRDRQLPLISFEAACGVGRGGRAGADCGVEHPWRTADVEVYCVGDPGDSAFVQAR